jgi:hypothetical protein
MPTTTFTIPGDQPSEFSDHGSPLLGPPALGRAPPGLAPEEGPGGGPEPGDVAPVPARLDVARAWALALGVPPGGPYLDAAPGRPRKLPARG